MPDDEEIVRELIRCPSRFIILSLYSVYNGITESKQMSKSLYA